MYKITTLLPILAAAAIAIALLSKLQISKRKNSFAPPKAKNPVTKNEQPMYFRLTEAFPDHIVLAQVSLGALLQSPSRATRNRYDRKIADFVLCTKAFKVVAVIELDDSSHQGKEHLDAARDALLITAGYKTLRYRRIPDIAALLSDITLLLFVSLI